jgi:nucleoside-diphosphate-sugar epimerase
VLLERGCRVRVSARGAAPWPVPAVEPVIGDLRERAVADRLVSGAEVVVHLAGLAHVLDRGATLHQSMVQLNLDMTLQLARSAIEHGAKRVVFVSTIGVFGSRSPVGQALTEASAPRPEGDYARSKLAAERGLLALSRDGGLEITTVRPTLVFGPGAPGNVERLVRLVARGLPLPFGGLAAAHSFIGVRNLADLLAICCVHPRAGGELIVAADTPTLTLPEVVKLLGRGLRRSVRLLTIPEAMLALGAGLFGKSNDFAKLSAALVVDASKARTHLGWRPHQNLCDSVRETGAHFLMREVHRGRDA